MPSLDVLDSEIHYREAGSGRPFVFLHGNPTSSHLWRRVMPAVGDPARRLAPDLIGMGASGKPDVGYRFADHARYLDAWFDGLGLDGVVLVGHDWGGALAFDWARRHPDRVRAVAFLETIVRPMAWDAFPESARPIFAALRTPGRGEEMVLEENLFIEQALPAGVRAGLADADRAAYGEPYATPESRRPLLQWPREMPLGGEPADVVERVEAYDLWLSESEGVPKLLLAFDPGQGIMIGPDLVAWCEANVAALEVEHCGAAGHHAPEDQPEAIAAAISGWADRHGLRG
ncbi:MAG TPA: haloalkane dehalogenase [Solirubrobacterales bacterium]|jgi:haloalkane dehalogenase